MVDLANSALPPLVINGRYLTRRFTGVERVAHEMITELMSMRRSERYVVVLVPKRVKLLGLEDTDLPSNIKLERVGHLHGHWWEQLELPRYIGHRWLLSLCNTGPIKIRRQAVMFHDAQIYDAAHSYSFRFRTLYRQLQPRLARRAELVLTVSSHSRQRLECHGVVPPNKAIVIHNGVDHITRAVADDTALVRFGLYPQKYLLTVGSLAPNKNLSLLLRAAAARPDGAMPLVIAGAGNTRTFAAAGIEVSDGTRLLGRVTERELKSLYSNAYAFLFPSISEGFGLPPLEAMLCGCAVIATTGGAVPEICSAAAMYVDPHNERGWTDAMMMLEADPVLRDSLADRGLAHAKTFTWQAAAAKLSMAIIEKSRRSDTDDRCAECG